MLTRVLSIRLRAVLRGHLGATYDINTFFNTQRSPHPEQTVTIQFGCDPDRVDELVQVALDQVHAIQQHGPTDDEVEKAMQISLRSREQALSTNRFWLDRLAESDRFGDDPTRLMDTAIIKQATPDGIRRAANAYLDLANHYEAVVLPEQP